jgi:hypothetical protein
MSVEIETGGKRDRQGLCVAYLMSPGSSYVKIPKLGAVAYACNPNYSGG